MRVTNMLEKWSCIYGEIAKKITWAIDEWLSFLGTRTGNDQGWRLGLYPDWGTTFPVGNWGKYDTLNFLIVGP